VALFGEKLHLYYADDPDEARERAEASLKKAGLEAPRVRQVEPSLEDLFVSLLR
jgi:ABC-2 type transport system ATP-binding protein